MFGWLWGKINGLKTVDEIGKEEILQRAIKTDVYCSLKCAFCDKKAIGYETHQNCGFRVCEDHADRVTLMLPPGYEIDLLEGKPKSTSYGGYTYLGGYRKRFRLEEK